MERQKAELQTSFAFLQAEQARGEAGAAKGAALSIALAAVKSKQEMMTMMMGMESCRVEEVEDETPGGAGRVRALGPAAGGAGARLAIGAPPEAGKGGSGGKGQRKRSSAEQAEAADDAEPGRAYQRTDGAVPAAAAAAAAGPGADARGNRQAGGAAAPPTT
eukprot:gene10153-14418_t